MRLKERQVRVESSAECRPRRSLWLVPFAQHDAKGPGPILGGFPKLGVPFGEVPIIRTTTYWDLYLHPLLWETTIFLPSFSRSNCLHTYRPSIATSRGPTFFLTRMACAPFMLRYPDYTNKIYKQCPGTAKMADFGLSCVPSSTFT